MRPSPLQLALLGLLGIGLTLAGQGGRAVAQAPVLEAPPLPD